MQFACLLQQGREQHGVYRILLYGRGVDYDYKIRLYVLDEKQEDRQVHMYIYICHSLVAHIFTYEVVFGIQVCYVLFLYGFTS